MKTGNSINAGLDRESQEEHKLYFSQSLHQAIISFLENHPTDRLSRNLRTMLLEYLQHEGVTESLYLKDLLFDLSGLFELLEVIRLVGIKDPKTNNLRPD